MSAVFVKAAMLSGLGALVLALGGCREEELGRPLSYEKGEYRGAPDEPLPPATVEQLRERMRGQGAGSL